VDSNQPATAYLVIREGTKWTDVYRLIPGQVVTIGRSATNQIVVKDERCSRNHSEIFYSHNRWTLRDLDSRNGTAVGDARIQGDYPLSPGDIVRIGQWQLAYVHDLSTAFPDSSGVLKKTMLAKGVGQVDAEHVFSDKESEPALITHRRDQSKFLDQLPAVEEELVAAPKVGQAAAKLCRLAFDLAKAPDVESMANIALSGLFDEIPVDAGAVLLLPRDFRGEPTREDLQVVASRSDSNLSYYGLSDFLAATVLQEGEAVLARNVTDDSTIGTRDSKGHILASSILCAPIRHGKHIGGMVHLYSTDGAREPDPDDLEFTLAVADTVAVAVDNLSRRQELAEDLDQIRAENIQLIERLGVQSEIVGSSAPMMRVTQEIARAAPSRTTVLVRGESGVGKELVARAVHFSSPRRKGPFICLNCAALSETLLESELFGHERGAFTGATERKQGKFELAHGGTLMLDEIGEMSQTIQAKFLRVLEGHPFERVGGSESISADVRVIAATNRDLEKDVAERRFRRDLYFRLHVIEIFVPPLRKRPEDIVELAHYFLKKFVEETGRKIRGFTTEAMQQIERYRWPGNVRELKNVVERAVVLCRGPYIDRGDLMLSNLATAGDTVDHPQPNDFEPTSLAEMERRHILAVLKSTAWNKSQTAQILGIERSTLDRKIRRYELAKKATPPPGLEAY
jgi:Nif-specific regulatory protein